VSTSDPDKCWEWLKAKDRDGYGLVWYNNKWQTAHRVSWIIFHSPILNGEWVLHKCNNKSCVNPYHLHLGDHIDNVRDAISSGAYIKYHQRKLSSSEVYIVKQLLNTRMTLRRIADKFGVSHQTIWKISKGHRYAI